MASLFETTEVRIGDASAEEGARAFDFLHGDWSVVHRRLRHRLAGDTHWDAFSGLISCKPIIGGLGNIDDNLIELPTGTYRAATVRLFDAAAGLWSIWWADGRIGKLDVPVIGGFTGGVGTFFADDILDGKPVKVRFTWSGIRPDAANWTQAFSPNSGETWETNWEMRFTRL